MSDNFKIIVTGPIGSVKLAFLKDFTRFEDLATIDPSEHLSYEE